MEEERFCFIVEWYDPHAAFIRKYQLVYYPTDQTMEMYDMKSHRMFLRRTQADFRPEELYIGSCVNVLSRQLTFVDYGDEFTRKNMNTNTERTLGLIKPDAVGRAGAVLSDVYRSGFLISQLRMCRLSRDEAMSFYVDHKSKPFFNDLVSFMSSGPVIAIEMMGSSAITRWRELLGPTDSEVARSEAPQSVRARFGQDSTRNACHGSDSTECAAQEIDFFFGPAARGANTASCDSCTCCIIKPHAVQEGTAGQIIEKVLESFEVGALRMFHLEQANAEEFYEVYKGVVKEYPEMVKELTSGPCIAMEIRPRGDGPDGPDGTTATGFRQFAGPADPEIARHLRSTTLRAQFGRDKVKNAVHCTDLPEDGQLEVEYFFKILS